MGKLIGRTEEIKELENCYNSDRPEFVIVYGRRRIGKTFLVRQLFKNKFTFSFVGGHNETTREQLWRFHSDLRDQFNQVVVPEFKNWIEALQALRNLLSALPHDSRKVIFFDEMPWMDTPKSKFITALEIFWNGWASARDDIMLVACGSSTSWMINKIIGNHGGLYGRVTKQIYLKPFKLRECEQLLQGKNGRWDRYQITQAYMALGGVPYYFDMLDINLSLAQNIDKLFFDNAAHLNKEFDQLYATLFTYPENYIDVVRVLAKHPGGLTRKQIAEQTNVGGGGLTTVLKNLEKCDLINSFSQFHGKTKAVYQLVDFFSLFYFKFIENNKTKDKQYWSHHLNSPAIYNWQGHAFEVVALIHLEQIKKKLGIAGISTACYAWHNKEAQIDLVIERADRMINICEIKFAENTYEITKNYAEKLRNKIGAFSNATKTRYGIHLTMITTFGIVRSMYGFMANSEVTLDDFFEEEPNIFI